MDIFVEQLVTREKTAKDTMINFLMIMSIVVILALGLVLGAINFYFIMVSLFAAAFDVYACWYVITGRNQEFEYIITNNNLTIDRVMAKRRRKHVINVNIKNIKEMHKIKSKKLDDSSVKKIIYAGKTENGADEYQALVKTEKYGDAIIIFSPNEKTLAAMKSFLAQNVVRDIYYK